jgi:DNA-binding NarL/FixJ family response regulator
MKRARILLADDHSITLAGIQSLLEPNWELVGQVRDGRALVEAALRLRPDLIILDVSMPLLNGIDAAKQIRTEWQAAKLLFVTMHANAMYLREAMRSGASGYLLKSSAAEELRPAVRKILRGGIYIAPAFGPEAVEALQTSSGRNPGPTMLTTRQREVLQMVAEGRSNKEIATILRVSPKTVEFHRSQIMRKLGMHTVAQLTTFAIRDGLIAG